MKSPQPEGVDECQPAQVEDTLGPVRRFLSTGSDRIIEERTVAMAVA